MPANFAPAKSPSVFRRIAASMWGRPTDPTIYGYMDIDATACQAAIVRARECTGAKVTMTHAVAYAVAQCLDELPAVNAKVRHWGRVEQRDAVDLLISVATDGGRDLAAAKVECAERLSFDDLVHRVNTQVERTRNHEDAHRSSRQAIDRLPWWLVRPALRFTDLVGNELHLHLPSLGMPRDPFGSAIITNVGGFGIDTAFAPLPPLARVPMLFLVTEVRHRPTCVGSKVIARPTLRLCASFDHRIVDGAQAGQIAASIRRTLEAPAFGHSAEVTHVAV